ncbi:hypothetical protein ScPMuIL_015100 [Solemya velum]
MPSFKVVDGAIDTSRTLHQFINPELFVPELRSDLPSIEVENIECKQANKGRTAAADELLKTLKRHPGSFLKFLVIYEKSKYDKRILNRMRSKLLPCDIIELENLREEHGLEPQSQNPHPLGGLQEQQTVIMQKKKMDGHGSATCSQYSIPVQTIDGVSKSGVNSFPKSSKTFTSLQPYMPDDKQKDIIEGASSLDGDHSLRNMEGPKSFPNLRPNEKEMETGAHWFAGVMHKSPFSSQSPSMNQQEAGEENEDSSTFHDENQFFNNLDDPEVKRKTDNEKNLGGLLNQLSPQDKVENRDPETTVTPENKMHTFHQEAVGDPEGMQSAKSLCLEANRIQEDREGAISGQGKYRNIHQ